MGQKLQKENVRELTAKSLVDRKLSQEDGVTEQCVNQSRTVEKRLRACCFSSEGSGESCDHLVV